MARTVERGKNPEDGSGEEVAILALPGGPTADRVRRGTRRSGVSREQEPQERRTRDPRNDPARASVPDRRRGTGGYDAVKL